MSKNSVAMSEHSMSAHMESSDEESYSSGCQYASEEPSVS